jgi:Protein of unknown function (DUF2637)
MLPELVNRALTVRLPWARTPGGHEAPPKPAPPRKTGKPAAVDPATERTVQYVVKFMVTAVATATGVGFWLSYSNLHDFATRAGEKGAEAWAWPSTVDLFIVAGEAALLIGFLMHEKDPWGWVYLILGFSMSATGNVLHIMHGPLPWWAPFAAAGVPPVAALLALSALLRQGWRLAQYRAKARDAEERKQKLADHPGEPPHPLPSNVRDLRDRKPAAARQPRPRRSGDEIEARKTIEETLVAGEEPSARDIHRRYGVSRYMADLLIKEIREDLHNRSRGGLFNG